MEIINYHTHTLPPKKYISLADKLSIRKKKQRIAIP